MSSTISSPTSKPPSSTNSASANPSKHPEMAIRRPSQSNYADAQRAASAAAQAESSIDVPDGRRNSQGEALKSPVASWKPTFERKQSWNQQDLRREAQRAEWEKTGAEKTGAATGFSEK